MLENRIAKAIMVASLALFALLVAFDNLTDYDTNYAFVRHVLSMETTFPGNALLYRRVTSPVLWQAGYALIIAGEGPDRHRPGGRDHLPRPASALRRRPLQSCKAFHDHRRVARVSGVVFRFHGRWRRVVFHVAIADVERPGGGLSLLHDDPCGVDLRQPVGRRPGRSRDGRQPTMRQGGKSCG